MTIALIAVLVGIAAFLGKRWSDANAENLELPAKIVSLKRQLTQRAR